MDIMDRLKYLIGRLKYNYKTGNLAIKLIYINMGVYLFINLLSQINVRNKVISFLHLSSYAEDLLYRPWTLISYFFVHENFVHLFFNMLMLYVMGQFFYRSFSDKAFARFYFLGGISGGVFFLLYGLFSDYGSNLIGASAAIYSVFFAMVAYQPNLQVRLMFSQSPLKLSYVALGFLVLGFLFQSSNIGGNISHLGGAVFGYFYMKKFERGNDFFEKFFKKIESFFKSKTKLKVKKSTTYTRPPVDEVPPKYSNQEKIDTILDKISRSGYNSLTAEEKEFLFRQGKQK